MKSTLPICVAKTQPKLFNIVVTLFILLVSCEISWAQPVNNNCASPTALTVDAPCTNGTTVGATAVITEPQNPACWTDAAPKADNTVWYSFTTGAAGQYIISTDNGGTFDSQIAIYSGACGGLTQVGCDEDGGTVNTFSSVALVTLAASTTYLIQVDGYNSATGTFCINVTFPVPPSNDCPFNAIDITSQINGLSTTNLFDCSTRTYNTPGAGGAPTMTTLTGDPSGCNGYDITGTVPWPDHYDVWFRFTVTPGTTPPAWLSIYNQTGTTPSYSAAVYTGTPTGTCAGSVGGLTQYECSSGEIIGIPPGNDSGGANDEGPCSTPLRPRIDISALPAGTYYYRVWEYGGLNPPTDGIFNLCAEYGIPSSPSTDGCPGASSVGCIEASANQDLIVTYPNTGNNASHGNACNTAPNEPQLAASAAGQFRLCGAIPWTTSIGYANNVMNNTAIYQFNVNASGTCVPTVLLQFANIQYGGTNGNVAQIQVMNGACASGASAVMTATTAAPCLQMQPAGGSLPNGDYFIVVDGQDGQLLQYDLTINIDYQGVGCVSGTCDVILGASYLSLGGQKLEPRKNELSWITDSEVNNDYYGVERSEDGLKFKQIALVEGNGTTTTVTHYEFLDNEAPEELTYYRLRQVDFDGEVTYSPIISISNNVRTEGTVEVIINNDKDELYATFQSKTEIPVNAQIIDFSGNVLITQKRETSRGSNILVFETDNLVPGAYLIRIEQDGVTSKAKFVLN